MIYFALSSIGLVVALAATRWIHSRYHLAVVARAQPPHSPAPLVSVIVPARDEERNIRRCVEALLFQSYPNLELIVVDDGSSDATPRILGDLAGQHTRLQVIEGAPLPQGWAGKPHALAQGAQRARGAWLCFIDADTFAAPHLLASTLATAEELQVDLLSLLTAQKLESFWEKVILPLVFTALSVGYPADRVNDPDRPEAIANGQFILIRRAVYDAVGGHEAVRDSVVEDKDLAEVVKGQGYRLLIADGRHLARTRMYTSLGEIWEGWTKNIYLGLGGRRGLLLLGAVMNLIASFGLPAWLIVGAFWWARGGGQWAVLVTLEAAALWTVILYYRAQAARAFAISPWYALSLPLGTLIFSAMMLASTLRVVSGRGVSWKGRRYAQK